MKTNKNIDRLYQEKFKDFEATPNPQIWQNIETSLQKKKRKVLPFWWVSGGAIASLLVGLVLFPFSSNKSKNTINLDKQIVTESTFKTPENTPQVKESIPLVVTETKKEEIPTKKLIRNKTVKTHKVEIAQKIPSLISKEHNKAQKIKPKRTHTSNAVKNNLTKKEKETTKSKNTKQLKTNEAYLKKDLVAQASKKEKVEKNNTKMQHKWEVTPSFAVLNANSFSKTSTIDANLNNNSVSGENTYSYGVKVAYRLNKKWAIQSGIHLQEMQFNTNNVTLISVNSNKNSSINFTENAIKFSDSSLGLSSSNPNLITNQAVINQKFGYIEIPIELKYSLLNTTKFNTNIVTGLSTLFLNKNEIKATATNFSKVLGEATNLNTINFSGNIGLDFNYTFNKNLILNLNPMFKSQLNTFSKNANGFKPYTIGVYTGIKYTF